MHVVIRHYQNSSELIDELADRPTEVEELIRGVPGFVAYYLVKTADGGASISVYEDGAGTSASTQMAAAFVRDNLASVAAGPPQVIEGEAVIQFDR